MNTDLRPLPQPRHAPTELPGQLLTVLRSGHLVVWLFGDVDPALAAELDLVAAHAPRVADRLTIDGSRVTFCDTTLLRFIAHMASVLPVTIRRPTRMFVEILTFAGLSDLLSDPLSDPLSD